LFKFKRWIVAGAFALGTALPFVGHGPANAVAACNDGAGGEIEVPVVVGGNTVAIEVTNSAGLFHVGVCYQFGATAGEDVFVEAQPIGTTQVRCIDTTGIGANCFASTNNTPTFTLAPPPTGNGDVITVQVPAQVCVGSSTNCPVNTAFNLATTGVQYTLACPTLSSCTLTNTAVYVDGIPVGIGTTGGGVALGGGPLLGDALAPDPAGPCVLGVCPPDNGYIETTGSPIVYITALVDGIGVVNFPVAIPKECIYSHNATCP